ncbi:MAG TPA: NTPase [Candidatus Aerophobetes bacterium]|uniref:NTPase n=1 Tax=Aerophobetes bacterium TaxID=2030807 RepID=A0A7V5M054_UNCAE|nr:NTPase [Candidatus Aerophobetes bacterium]
MNILIQGPPGTGKTTAIKKIIKLLKNCQGFYTEEIREKGERVGFLVRNLDGKEEVFAHKDFNTSCRVGKYRVDVEKFENIALPALEKGLKEGKILIVDEIGKMEIFSEKFKEKIEEALKSSSTVIATLPQKITDEIKKIINGKNYRIVLLTRTTRDKVPSLVLDLLEKKIDL